MAQRAIRAMRRGAAWIAVWAVHDVTIRTLVKFVTGVNLAGAAGQTCSRQRHDKRHGDCQEFHNLPPRALSNFLKRRYGSPQSSDAEGMARRGFIASQASVLVLFPTLH